MPAVRYLRRLALLLLAALVIPLIMSPTLLAPARAADADTAIYSPGTAPGAIHTVAGSVYQDQQGLVTVINPLDTPINGAKVYAYWVDEDGAVSPTYYDVTRTINGATGSFVIELDDYRDAAGTLHTFAAGPAEQLRVWIDNPDSTKYEISFGESQYVLGTSTKRDANAWNMVGHYVENWNITLREIPLASQELPDALQVDRSGTSGASAIDPGNVSGAVFWDWAHTWGATVGANYDLALGDKPAAGVKVTASYLTDGAINLINQWKSLHPGWTEEQLQTYIQAQVAANPTAWIAETIYSYTNANGEFDMTWKAAPADVNKTFMNVRIDAPNGTIVYGPWDNNNWASPSSQLAAYQTNGGVIGGASNVKFALLPGDPKFDVLNYNTTTKPAINGNTAPTSTVGLPPNMSGFKILWTDPAGNVVKDCLNLSTTSTGTLSSCNFTVPDGLTAPTTYTATLYNPSGTRMSADSFIALPSKIVTPAGSVGEPYAGAQFSVTPPSGARVNYTSSTLPAGLKLDPATGKITGTPTVAGTVPVTVTATITAADGSVSTIPLTGDIMITDTPLPGGTVGDSYLGNVIPTGLPAGAVFSGLKVNSGLPAGLSFDPATGLITGTPTTAGTFNVDITYTVTRADGSTVQAHDIVPVTINPADKTPPAITPISNVRTPGDTAITPILVTSDDPDASYSVTGLPAGLTFNPATGEITGVPINLGTSTVTVTATDAKGNTSTTTFTIEVYDNILPAFGAMTDITNPVGYEMTPYLVTIDDPTATITVSGLPAGVTFDPATNLLTGTPTTVGSYPVVFTAVDPSGNTSTTTITYEVTPINTAATQAVTVPEDVAITPISIETDPAATTTVTTLPTGLTFNDATGEITGTPTEPGVYQIDYTTRNKNGTVTNGTVILTVTDTTAPVITANNGSGVAGTAITPISVTVDDPGAQLTFTGLPDGLSYDLANSEISGTPTTPGVYTVTITATDAAGNTATRDITITIADETAPYIAPIADVTTPVGNPMTPITVTTDDPTATTTVTGLPAGVTFDPATGDITGTPTTPGTYPVTVTSTDPAGNTTSTTFTITVVDVTPPAITPINDVTTPGGSPMTPITVTTDDPNATIAVTGLPDGVTFDPTTGTISGTPTTPGSYPVTVIANDAAGNPSTETFIITVTDTVPPVIELIADRRVPEDEPIVPIAVTVDDPSATTTLTGLPDGLSYDPATSTISGTPTTLGEYVVTVTSTDAAGNTSKQDFTITVLDTTAPTVQPIADVSVPSGTPITPITAVSNDPNVSWVTSAPPAGITFDPATGTYSGTPTVPGNYPMQLLATDPAGNTTLVTFTINVFDSTPPVIEPITDQNVNAGSAIAPIQVVASDPDSTTLETTVTGLPDGVTYNPVTGIIAGSPTIPGSYPVSVSVRDAAGNTVVETFTITVIDANAPAITPIDDMTAPAGTAIAPIPVTVNEPDATIQVNGLPAGVTFDPATGVISGTPTTPGSYVVIVTAVDAAGNASSETFIMTITDENAPTITPIDDQTLNQGQAITPVTVKVDDPNAVVTVDGLPAGVTFDPATGVISGTPTTSGAYPVTVTARDAAGNTTSETFTITVNDATAPQLAPINDLTVPEDTAILPIQIVTDDATATVSVTGLPDGLLVDAATRQIIGTPTTPGTYPVTVSVTDQQGNTAYEAFVITVTDKTPPVIAPISDQTVNEGTPIASVTVTSDDPAAQYTVVGLPDGVTFDAASGTISGSPTTPGSYPVTVIATGAGANTSSETFTITVLDTTAPTIEAIADQTAPAGSAITAIPVVVNDPSASVQVNGLPDGLVYDPATGTIVGTPTVIGTFPVVIVVTDPSGNTVSESFVFTVTDPSAPAITPIDDQAVNAGSPMTPVTVVQNDPTATVTVDGLPAGVNYDPATGTISGTPTTVGSYPVTVTATDPAGNTSTETFIITVNDANAPAITPIDDVVVPLGTALAPIQVQTDDPNATITVNGLPAGATFDPATGTITGTPTAAGDYPVSVTATDAQGNVSTESFVTHVISQLAPTIQPIADVSVPEDQAITPIPVTVSDPNAAVIVTGLPEGLVYDPNSHAIVGVPTTPGNYPTTVTVVVVDAAGNSSTEYFTITVTDATAPVITPIDDQHGVVGSAITPINVVTDDPSATVVVDGLPDGVTFDPATGLIAGTPTTSGTYPVTVTATDPAGNMSSITFTITVDDAGAPKLAPITDQTVVVGNAIAPVTVSSDDPLAIYTVLGLPDGVSFDPLTHLITGAPTTPGSYRITVIATDAAGNTSRVLFTITVLDDAAPVLDPIPAVTVPEDQAMPTIPVTVDDPTATIVVTGLPEGTVYDPAAGGIIGVPTTPGTYPVTVTATDASGHTTTVTTTITVLDVTPPTIGAILDQKVPAGQAIEPITVVTDAPGTPIVNGLPDGVTFDPATGVITGIPTIPGTYPVTVTVTDEAGNPTTETFVITVFDQTAPVIDPIADQTTTTGTPITPVKITVDDPAATIVVTGLPDGVTFDPSTGTISGTPTVPGSYPVTVTVTDAAGNSSSEVFVITVNDDDAPTITPISDQKVVAGQPITTVTVKVDDPNATIEVTGLPNGTTFDPATGTITGTPTTPGDYLVTVTVTDPAGNTSSETFVITVTNPAEPTTELPSIPDTDGTIGEPITPIPVGPLPGGSTTDVSGLPGGLEYNPETGVIEGTPTQLGTFPVTVTVTLEDGTVITRSFTLTIHEAGDGFFDGLISTGGVFNALPLAGALLALGLGLTLLLVRRRRSGASE